MGLHDQGDGNNDRIYENNLHLVGFQVVFTLFSFGLCFEKR